LPVSIISIEYFYFHKFTNILERN